MAERLGETVSEYAGIENARPAQSRTRTRSHCATAREPELLSAAVFLSAYNNRCLHHRAERSGIAHGQPHCSVGQRRCESSQSAKRSLSKHASRPRFRPRVALGGRGLRRSHLGATSRRSYGRIWRRAMVLRIRRAALAAAKEIHSPTRRCSAPTRWRPGGPIEISRWRPAPEQRPKRNPPRQGRWNCAHHKYRSSYSTPPRRRNSRYSS